MRIRNKKLINRTQLQVLRSKGIEAEELLEAFSGNVGAAESIREKLGRPISKKLIDEIREQELARARVLRGHCSDCGHTYRPRNPSKQLNRCPACGRRGSVRLESFKEETEVAK